MQCDCIQKVSRLGKSQYFGEEEILRNCKRTTSAIVVSSKITVFSISKQVFILYIYIYILSYFLRIFSKFFMKMRFFIETFSQILKIKTLGLEHKSEIASKIEFHLQFKKFL